MKTLLRIDSSARIEGSRSRLLGDALEARWRARMPGAGVVRRDLAAEPLPHISATTIAAYYTPAEERSAALTDAVALSDRLIGELEAADAVLITSPMYNFGPPSALKAWIDHVVRIHRTVAYDGTTFRGLVTGKPAFVAIAYGAASYKPGGMLAGLDHLKPYLEQLLRFIGFEQVEIITAEATNGAAEAAAGEFDAALRTIEALDSLAA